VTRFRQILMSAVLLAAGSAAAGAGAADDAVLERYLVGLRSLRAAFSQVTLDASGKVVEKGAGSLVVARPGRFRWEFRPEGGDPQLLVADGRNLWLYDQELQQVTVKPAASALAATPIVLLSGGMAEARAAFEFSALPARDGMEQLRVTPRGASADFASAELGFRGDELQRLVIHDRLAQVVTLEFSHAARNARVTDGELSFRPPAGADLIGTPQPP
jgi:outer membrane lipoprotein carrier protein